VLFPIRDSIPSRIKPIVTTGIIVVCGLTFVYELFVGANLPALFDIAGFIPARLFDTLPAALIPSPDYGLIGNLVTLVTSMFLHGGWMHLIGNMWFLYIFGDNIEGVLGHGKYLLFYLGGGVSASLVHGLTDASSVLPTVGASGAIAAVLGAYIVWFPQSRIHTLVFLGFFITVTEIPALVYLGFWFLLQAFGGTVSMAAAPGAGGVAWFAHIGGFVFGVAVAFWVKQRGKVKPPQPRPRVWYGG
jgi:membrane associated rhomboid family serine protease